MIRYFYSVCFLAIGTGLPLLAKNTGTDKPTPSTSSKAGSKGIPSSFAPAASSQAQAKEQSHKKTEVIVTSDLSRAAASALVAKQQGASSPLPSRTEQKESRTEREASTVKEKRPFFEICPSGFPPRGDLTRSSVQVPIQAPLNSGRLARVTAYWSGEGDYYTGRGISATGVRLHDGHCAVDPSIIPYGSVVEIAGVGKYLAVDTGSAVISRTAAREGGHTSAERNAIVIDLFFEDASEGEKFAAGAAKYVAISWWTPTATNSQARTARSLFAEEDWTKIQGKQL